MLLLAGLVPPLAQGAETENTAAPKSSARLLALDEKFRQTVTQFGDQAAVSAALKQRRADWQALLKSIEEIDPAKMTGDDHATAAILYQRLGLPEESVPHAEAAVKKDPQSELNRMLLVVTLVDNKQLDAAEAAYAAAAAALPESKSVKQLLLRLSGAQLGTGSATKGTDHLISYLDAERRTLAPGVYLARVDQLVNALRRAERAGEIPARLESELAAIAAWAAAEPQAPLAPVAAELTARQVRYLAESGKMDEAQGLLKSELAAAEKRLGEKPDDTTLALVVIPLLETQLDLAKDGKAFATAQASYLKFLAAVAQKHPQSADAMRACLESPAAAISRLATAERGDAATGLVEGVKTLLGEIKPEGTAAEQAFLMSQEKIGQAAQRLKLEQSHAALLGQDAVPLKPDDWVNGSPLTDEELRGKVVLLDFWAVWCGPCIATFPHLREWQEKYADKGLVIIGVTNYYKYGWNAEQQRAEPVEGITPEQERLALEEFAKHHELKHRFAVMPEMSDFAEKYGVQGIPQVVVIDRQGKIRLIKVGSGPENAEAIQTMLDRLLGDGATPCK
ncbi:MAG: TlpA family protein disulfide reductase [Planctomycetaceae bacterium]|nr:TlpA family protein disulfide reductase [Planctomycetaceae bacterium]